MGQDAKVQKELFGRAARLYFSSLEMARDAFEAMERARLKAGLPSLPDPTKGLFAVDFKARTKLFRDVCKAQKIDL